MHVTFLAAVLLGLCVGCGSSSSGSGPSSTGNFLDGPVQGLRYEGDTFVGTTGADGRYQYREGDMVCFFLGLMELGCVEATGVVTPIDLFSDALSTDDEVQNVVRLLLSLDADQDLDNGIDVSAVPANAADPGFDLEQVVGDFESDTDVLAYVALYGPRVDLVDASTAASHFATTLEESDYFEQELLGQWHYTRTETETGFRVPVEVATLDIEMEDVASLEIDVEEDGEVDLVRDTGTGESDCAHDGDLEDDDLVMGETDCGAAALGVEDPADFRMDRMGGDVSYSADDLVGEWVLITVTSVPTGVAFGTEVVDAEWIAANVATVSASGALSLSRTVGEELCSFAGSMNAAKSFVSGDFDCPLGDDGVWQMMDSDDYLGSL